MIDVQPVVVSSTRSTFIDGLALRAKLDFKCLQLDGASAEHRLSSTEGGPLESQPLFAVDREVDAPLGPRGKLKATDLNITHDLLEVF